MAGLSRVGDLLLHHRRIFPNPRLAVSTENSPVCTIVVDAEEDFDWRNPVYGTEYTTANMRNIGTLQAIASAYGIAPTYLLTYPVLEANDVVQLLRRRIDRGECEVGAQLHPWVTPPFDGDGDGAARTSYAGNLAPELEERKLVELIRKFTGVFGTPPTMYRAGRYGIGRQSAALLERHGFTIDTSLAPRTTFEANNGPNFTSYGYRPFWFGEEGSLLEIPLCREVVGWTGHWAPKVYHALSDSSLSHVPMLALASRLRCAERITLSPEGNDVRAMRRLVRSLYAAGQRVFVISFHSSSLTIGRNPYVQTKADMHHFYDRLSGILDMMSRELSMRFVKLSNIPAHLQAAPPTHVAAPAPQSSLP